MVDTLFLVVAGCGDYYCEGVHVVAVATTRDRADELKTEAENAMWANVYGSSGHRWTDVTVEEAPTNQLRDQAKSYIYGNPTQPRHQ